MLDSLLLTEIMADQKRKALEERIKLSQLAAIAQAHEPGPGLRGAIATAIVRFGILLDGTAGRRAAAASSQHAAAHAAAQH